MFGISSEYGVNNSLLIALLHFSLLFYDLFCITQFVQGTNLPILSTKNEAITSDLLSFIIHFNGNKSDRKTLP